MKTKPSDWKIIGEDEKLQKEFLFAGFAEALKFVQKVGKQAEKENHHPDIHIYFKKVVIETTSHDKGNKITEKDTKLAEQIDKIFNRETI